jgi:hypothetical protein
VEKSKIGDKTMGNTDIFEAIAKEYVRDLFTKYVI